MLRIATWLCSSKDEGSSRPERIPFWGGIAGVLLLTLAPVVGYAAQQPAALPGSEECANCHDSGRATRKREAGVPPAFDAAALRASPHATLECVSCHVELASKEFPHPEKLQKVDCGMCHSAEQEQHTASLHGQAAKRAFVSGEESLGSFCSHRLRS